MKIILLTLIFICIRTQAQDSLSYFFINEFLSSLDQHYVFLYNKNVKILRNGNDTLEVFAKLKNSIPTNILRNTIKKNNYQENTWNRTLLTRKAIIVDDTTVELFLALGHNYMEIDKNLLFIWNSLPLTYKRIVELSLPLFINYQNDKYVIFRFGEKERDGFEIQFIQNKIYVFNILDDGTWLEYSD